MASATLVQDSSAGNTCPVPFTFKDHQIRTVAIDDQPWFVAKDVCAALDISWQRGDKTLAQVSADWKRGWEFPTPKGKRFATVIAEPAVYKLAFRSNKPEADAFTNWVASEVLPAIRKTGQFAPAPAGVLTPAQCRHLHDVLDAKVGTLPKEHHRSAYAEAWTRFNRHFRIAKYAQLPQEQFSDALAYLIGMKIVAGSLGPTAQKALPPAPRPRYELPTASEIDGLVSAVQFRGSEMHKAMDDLWEALYPNGAPWGNGVRYVALTQLRYTSDNIFTTMTSHIEACRRMATAVSVAYRQFRELDAMRE